MCCVLCWFLASLFLEIMTRNSLFALVIPFIALLSTSNQNVNLEGRVGAVTDFSTPQHVLKDQIVDTLKVLGFMALQAARSESSGF